MFDVTTLPGEAWSTDSAWATGRMETCIVGQCARDLFRTAELPLGLPPEAGCLQ